MTATGSFSSGPFRHRKDDGIDIQTIRSFVKDLQPSYAAYPE